MLAQAKSFEGHRAVIVLLRNDHGPPSRAGTGLGGIAYESVGHRSLVFARDRDAVALGVVGRPAREDRRDNRDNAQDSQGAAPVDTAPGALLT